MEHTTLNHQRVVIDVYRHRIVEAHHECFRAALRGLDASGRNRSAARGDDLLSEVVEIGTQHSHTAVRDEVADVGCLRGLMDEVAVAERNFQLAQRVAWIASLDDFAGAHALVVAHPIAGWRYPRRIPDDLARAAVADVNRIVLHANADIVRLHFLAVLPQREAEGRHV